MTDPRTTSGPFASATSVTPVGEGAYGAAVRPGWDIAGNANGGYLLTIGARALLDATGRADPVSVTGHYLSPGRPGPIDISTRVLKQGRRFSDGFALMEAAGKPLLSVLGTFGELVDRPEEFLVDGSPPELPPPDACVPMDPSHGSPPFMGKVELRLHPDDAGFATGVKSGVPRVTGWFRLPDREPVDTLALLCAADAFPPTIFNADIPLAWTPTVEFTVHVRARPEPGWLRCRFTTRFITGGFIEVDGEIWDARSRLVAQSRQLALVPLA
jgi:acyl-CoA thioesterase